MAKKYRYHCKYCGAMNTGNICYHCQEKLKLIRIIQKMVRNKKKEVEEKNG